MRRSIAMSAALLALVLVACQEKKGAAPSVPTGSAPAASAADADTLLLGEVGSLSGQEATFGVSTHHGIELALKEINAAGGVKGKKLAVKVYDDQGKPEEAATAATKLVTLDKVVLLLGEVASTRSLNMAPIAQNNKIPMISPSSTNPKVTLVGDYVFRVCFIDPFQGTVMAKFARESLKAQRVAVLKDVRNDYSVGLTQYFTEKLKALGGTVVKEESYSAGDKDFKAQLTSIRAVKPDAIYVPGYYTDVGLIASQAKELGIPAPLMGGDGWDSSKLYEIGGEAIEGSYFSNHYSVEDPSPRIQRFVQDYKAAYGEVPDSLAALGYDAAKIAADALARAKSFSGPDLRDAIAATKDFEGVTGRISIDAKRNAVKPAVVLKVQGGKAVYQTTVAP